MFSLFAYGVTFGQASLGLNQTNEQQDSRRYASKAKDNSTRNDTKPVAAQLHRFPKPPLRTSR
jgi:hypothetical protein